MRGVKPWLWCAGWLAALGGCSPSEEDLTTVRGEVTFGGRPLAGGMIVFAPDPEHGEDGPIATAKIAPDGSYSLKCDLGDGAVTGWHRVAIAPPAGTVDGVPRRYRRPDLSGLICEVAPGEENVFDFALPEG